MENVDYLVSDDEIRLLVSFYIKKYREEAGLTQTELGDKIGKAKTTVASWEQGKSLPDPGLLYRIAGYLGKDIRQMYGED